MGRINFFRRLVHNFIIMVKPIHNMMKHEEYFSCIDDVEKYFIGIKK
jgi:hypothetical protein